MVGSINRGRSTHSEYKSFNQDCVHIGRGFNNDLIINDPFVAATHLSLRLVDGGWECENNKSLNGTFILSAKGGAKVKVDKSCQIHSGDTIFLGKTIIHVWDINHVVEEEQALDSKLAIFADQHSTMRSLVFALCAFCFLGYLYLHLRSWEMDQSFTKICIGLLFILLFFIIWSAIWAVITRFSKHQHRFIQHLTFSVQWAILLFGTSAASEYVFFYVCNYEVENIVSILFFGLACIPILSTHLSIGTNLSFAKRTAVASSIAFLFIVFLSLGYYATFKDFNPKPTHYFSIVPIPKQLIPSIPISKGINQLDSIFDKGTK